MGNNLSSNFLGSSVCELERMAVEEAIKRRCFNPQPTALVLPGHCELTYELARKGVMVDASDEGEFVDDDVCDRLPSGTCNHIKFLPIGLSEGDDRLPHEPYDLIICRSGLCCQSYADARQSVKRMLRRLKIGGRLYLSMLGLHSALGNRYPAADQRVNERFSELHADVAEKYGISGPVCLYTERDMFILILEAGGSVLRTFTTTHGNLKGIAVRV